MDYLSRLTEQFASQIVKHRRYNYSQQSLYTFLENNPNIICKLFKILNKRGQNLQLSLFHNGEYPKSNTCILYAHGLGSNKIEILPIVQSFRNLSKKNSPSAEYHICSFDFSSSGRSEGSYTTYGVREQDDVLSVLAWLDSLKRYQRYVLWGRSMGAVSVVLSQSQQLNPKVQCLVLDSPFSSFEKVALQLANKRSIIPQFMLQLLIEPVKKYIAQNYPFNPFLIDVSTHIKRINLNILLMFSKGDSVISHQHSRLLKNHCRRPPFEIQLKQDHNVQRTKETIVKIIDFIHDTFKANSRKHKISESISKGRGINLTSKEKQRPRSNQRKGIFNSTYKNVPLISSSSNLETQGAEDDPSQEIRKRVQIKLNSDDRLKSNSDWRRRTGIVHLDSFNNSIVNSVNLGQALIHNTSMNSSKISEKDGLDKQNVMARYNVNHRSTQLASVNQDTNESKHLKKALVINSICQNIDNRFSKLFQAGKEARKININSLRNNRFR